MDIDQRTAFERAMRLIIRGIVEGSMETKVAARRLRAGADWLEDITGTGPTPAQVREVFEHWQTESGHTGTKLTDDRRKQIKARLRDRPVEALKSVISWAVRDEFYCKHATIGTLFRSSGKLEDYLSRSGWLDRAKPRPECTEQIPLEPKDPDPPRVPLDEFLAANPELTDKAQALKGVLHLVESGSDTIQVEHDPELIGDIIEGGE